MLSNLTRDVPAAVHHWGSSGKFVQGSGAELRGVRDRAPVWPMARHQKDFGRVYALWNCCRAWALSHAAHAAVRAIVPIPGHVGRLLCLTYAVGAAAGDGSHRWQGRAAISFYRIVCMPCPPRISGGQSIVPGARS